MNTQELEALAQSMYDACTPVKPEWTQLGDATRGVWREQAQAKMVGLRKAEPEQNAPATDTQPGLF